MAGWTDIPGAVAGTTVYSDGALVARNATVTLPEVSMTTVELPAGGTVEMPVPGLVDAMEMTVTLGASDDGFGDLSSPCPTRWRCAGRSRWSTRRARPRWSAYKAFANAYAKTIPGVSLEVGSAGENEMTLGCTRYRLVKDGEEILLIDQLNGIFKVMGTEYVDYSQLL